MIFLEVYELSDAPSSCPISNYKHDIEYIVRYSCQIQTVICTPFKIKETIDLLDMNITVLYELCDLDSIKENRCEFPNELKFMMNGNCNNTKGEHQTVGLNPAFDDHSSLHIIDLSGLWYPHNVILFKDMTFEEAWLLQTDMAAPVCSTNDYQDANLWYPDVVSNKFNSDKPIFAIFPWNQGHTIYEPRSILHVNILDLFNMHEGVPSMHRSALHASILITALK